MPSFLQKFFPDVYEQTQNPAPEASPYCSYDNQKLTLFTSSLFLAGETGQWGQGTAPACSRTQLGVADGAHFIPAPLPTPAPARAAPPHPCPPSSFQASS